MAFRFLSLHISTPKFNSRIRKSTAVDKLHWMEGCAYY